MINLHLLNTLATKIKADIVYIDPPYSSRQYSRFYHVLENIATWKKPKLYGIASKPIPENMSEYSKSTAINEFKDLIYKLKCKYIVLSYNNTYFSKKYYAKFNHSSYKKMKDIYNNEKNDNLYYLYLLLIYGFNRMLRFNKKNNFNIPVGNLDFNKNVKKL